MHSLSCPLEESRDASNDHLNKCFIVYLFYVCLFYVKETKSATMNIFRFFYFLFKPFVKVELRYVFTINLFPIAKNCTLE